MEALKEVSGDAILKFEPFVLHVQCQELQDAQILVNFYQWTYRHVGELNFKLEFYKMDAIIV